MAKDTKNKATPQDMQELSFVGGDRLMTPFIGLNRFGFFHSYNPDTLVGRKGMSIYDRMLLDDQIKAIQSMKKNAVLQPGWEIVPASDDPLDKEIAENVEWNFHIMQGTLDDRLREIMSSNDYGFSVSELIWHVIDHGTFQGKIGLKDIKSRSPHSWLFHVDEHGNLLGLEQQFLINQTQGQLPPDKFIIDVNDKKFGNMYGQSELRAAYRSFWAKENLMTWWNIYGERHAIPIAMGLYNQDNQITSPEHQGELKKIINVIQSKMSVLLPPGTKIDFKDVAKGGERFFVASISFHDLAMAKALLMPQLLGMSTQTKQGSFAQAKTQFSLFLLVLEKMQKQLEETVMLEQVIKRLVDFNYVVDKYPLFKFLPTTKEDKLETAKVWVEALKGQAVVSGIDDENKIRELLDFDEREETEEERERRLNPVPVVPVIKPPEKEEKPLEELSYRKERVYVLREPDAVEGKVDFARIEKNLEGIEDKFVEPLVETWNKQKGKLLDLVQKKVDKGTLDMRFINKELNLKFKQEIIRTLKEFMRAGHGLGMEDLNREAGGTRFAIDPILPKQAIKFLEDKSFWISDVSHNDILDGVKSTLINGLKTGASFKEMEESINDVYRPFIGDPTAITKTGVTSPFRTETIIRTNLNEAYNEGRKTMAADPALEGFIQGWEYSEILDSRTVPISKFMDGKKIKIDDPDLPRMSYPLHFSDRGVFVPVTIDDLPVKWMTQGQKGQAFKLMGKGFSGAAPVSVAPKAVPKLTKDEQDIADLVGVNLKFKKDPRALFDNMFTTDEEKRVFLGYANNWQAASTTPVSTAWKEALNKIHNTDTLFNGKYLDKDPELLNLNFNKVKQGLNMLDTNKSVAETVAKKMEAISRVLYQENFGKRKIAVYRGVDIKFFEKSGLTTPKTSGPFKLKTDSMSSWASNKKIAESFAQYPGRGGGFVLKAEIGVDDVAWLPFQESGLSLEKEIVLKQAVRDVEILEKLKALK